MRPVNHSSAFYTIVFTLVASCSIFHNASCQRINQCPPGVFDPTCSQPPCPSGTFGQNCSSTCPPNCLNSTCDVTSGLCHQCQPGFTGPQCQEKILCPVGFYGQNCSQKCPSGCSKNICDFHTGNCFGCVPGFLGAKCNTARDGSGEKGHELENSSVDHVTTTGKKSQRKTDPQNMVKQALMVFFVILVSVMVPVCVVSFFIFLVVRLTPKMEKVSNLLRRPREKRPPRRCIYRPSNSFNDFGESLGESEDNSSALRGYKRFFNRNSIKPKRRKGDMLNSKQISNIDSQSFDAGFSRMLQSSYYLDNELPLNSREMVSGSGSKTDNHSRKGKRRIRAGILGNGVVEISSSGLLQSTDQDDQHCDDLEYEEIQDTYEEESIVMTSEEEEEENFKALYAKPEKCQGLRTDPREQQFPTSDHLQHAHDISFSPEDFQKSRQDHSEGPKTRANFGTSLFELETGQLPVYMETTTPVPQTESRLPGIRSFPGIPRFLGNTKPYFQNVLGRLKGLLRGAKKTGPAIDNSPIDSALQNYTAPEKANLKEKAHSGSMLHDADRAISQSLRCGHDEGEMTRHSRVAVESAAKEFIPERDNAPTKSKSCEAKKYIEDAGLQSHLENPETGVETEEMHLKPYHVLDSLTDSVTDSHQKPRNREFQRRQKPTESAQNKMQGHVYEEIKMGVFRPQFPLPVNELDYLRKFFSSQKFDYLFPPKVSNFSFDEFGTLVTATPHAAHGQIPGVVSSEEAGGRIRRGREFEEEQGVFDGGAISLQTMKIWEQKDSPNRGCSISKSASSVDITAEEKHFTSGVFRSAGLDYLDLFIQEDTIPITSIYELSINCNQPLQYEKYPNRNIIAKPSPVPDLAAIPTSHPRLQSNVQSVNTAPSVGINAQTRTKYVQRVDDLAGILNQTALVYAVQSNSPRSAKNAPKIRLSTGPTDSDRTNKASKIKTKEISKQKTDDTNVKTDSSSSTTTSDYSTSHSTKTSKSSESRSQDKRRSYAGSKSCSTTTSGNSATEPSETETSTKTRSRRSFVPGKNSKNRWNATSTAKRSRVTFMTDLADDEGDATDSLSEGGSGVRKSFRRKRNLLAAPAVRNVRRGKRRRLDSASDPQTVTDTEEFFSDDEDSVSKCSTEGNAESDPTTTWHASNDTSSFMPRSANSFTPNASQHYESEVAFRNNRISQHSDWKNSQLTPSPNNKELGMIAGGAQNIQSPGLISLEERDTGHVCPRSEAQERKSNWLKISTRPSDKKKFNASPAIYVPRSRFKSPEDYSTLAVCDKEGLDGEETGLTVSNMRHNGAMSSGFPITFDRDECIGVPKSVTFVKNIEYRRPSDCVQHTNSVSDSIPLRSSLKNVGNYTARNLDSAPERQFHQFKFCPMKSTMKIRGAQDTDISRDSGQVFDADLYKTASRPRKRSFKVIEKNMREARGPSTFDTSVFKAGCSSKRIALDSFVKPNRSPPEEISDTETQFYSATYADVDSDGTDSEASLYTAVSSVGHDSGNKLRPSSMASMKLKSTGSRIRRGGEFTEKPTNNNTLDNQQQRAKTFSKEISFSGPFVDGN